MRSCLITLETDDGKCVKYCIDRTSTGDWVNFYKNNKRLLEGQPSVQGFQVGATDLIAEILGDVSAFIKTKVTQTPINKGGTDE